MRTLLTISLALCLCVSAAAADRGVMVKAISAVESNDRYWVVGRRGEVTAAQIMPRYWRLYTSAPLSRASRDPELGRLVALMHLDQLASELRTYGLQETPYNLALAWRAGSPAVAAGTATAVQRDHAQRVANLYESFTR